MYHKIPRLYTCIYPDRWSTREKYLYRSTSRYPQKVLVIISSLLVKLTTFHRIRRKRPSLRLIVSSATLDATSFKDYFTSGTSPEEATIISLEGRMYPVEVAYLQEPTPDYVRKAAEVAWDIHLQVCSLTSRENIWHRNNFLLARTRWHIGVPHWAGRHRTMPWRVIRNASNASYAELLDNQKLITCAACPVTLCDWILWHFMQDSRRMNNCVFLSLLNEAAVNSSYLQI